MKVLVTGAGGFLGRHAVDQLLRRGHQVRAIVRPASPVPPWPDSVEVFRADLRSEENLASAFNGIDAVLHLAAATSGGEDAQFNTTVVATEKFLAAMAKSPVRRLIHVSSLVVYDWSRIGDEMNESSPVLADPYSMGAYTIAKVWQERVVSRFAKQHGFDLTILRPGFVWGRDHAEIGGMGRHVGRIYLMFGPATRLPLTHVLNCADALAATVESKAAAGETFNVIDADDIRVWRYVSEYSRRTGQWGLMLPVPYHLGLGVAHLASLTSRALFGKKGKLPSLLSPRPYEWQFKPLRFSNRKLKDVLGWSPSHDFEQCLSLTYDTAK